MYILRILFVFISIILMPQTAFSDNLDAKWADDRKLFNQMGDKAKAGGSDVLPLLNEFAAAGAAPALHNLGWLYEHGSSGTPKDHDTSCAYFKKGSDLNYPPSQHGYAICLYQQAEKDRLGGPEGWEDTRYKADILMLDAAENGWVRSALYVSEDLMNRFDYVPDYATAALAAIENGLQSLPNDTQKRDLTYMKGIAHIYGPKPRDFKVAEDALFLARDMGHTAVAQVLPLLYDTWGQKVGNELRKWNPDISFAQDCYDWVRDPNFNLSALSLCNNMLLIELVEYTVIHKDIHYLRNRLAGLLEVSNDKLAVNRKRTIDEQIEALKFKKQKHDEAASIIDDKFMPLYRARKKAGE